ncbi:secondary thiamine-phosphate synthase enzyme YjbQ [Sulfurimonas sp. HSL-3221]|uniref:secondary thiamine-phosphate synthase enzyme YjbQ n=1 Tax=Sulfurimonadaceae TaxID=2771471 RepID=UPI001E2FB291|nr:secondary thiamine-phosphate synthase enzyme YjbQ [Sulfurimonas sp. HSL-3221]UFS61763.1 secondary thiamine-phosphate synthase enzyme YjbQ [Sulfurimonas sp. HSL-3221]
MFQTTVTLPPYPRGFHLITNAVDNAVAASGATTGLAHLFLKHTSASLCINENADPSVRRDMERFFSDVADAKPYYVHTYEGDDDMPAHIKSVMLGTSLTIPVTNGRLNLGTWQGIYLGEHRDHGGSRKIVITVY